MKAFIYFLYPNLTLFLGIFGIITYIGIKNDISLITLIRGIGFTFLALLGIGMLLYIEWV